MATSKEFQREQEGDVTDYASAYTEEQPKQCESYKVYHDKTPASKSGVIETQSDGQSRALPKSEAVKNPTVEKGKGPECAKKQLGQNLKPINSHVEHKQEFGPNN